MDTTEEQTPEISFDQLLKELLLHVGLVFSPEQETYLLRQANLQVLQQQEIISLSELAEAKEKLKQAESHLLIWFEREMKDHREAAEEMIKRALHGRITMQKFSLLLSEGKTHPRIQGYLLRMAMAYQQPEAADGVLSNQVQTAIHSLRQTTAEHGDIK